MPDDTTTDTDAGATPTTTTTPTADESGAEHLGDAGKKALDAMKARVKAAESEAKRAKDLEAKLAEYEDRDRSELEKAVARAEKAEAQNTEMAERVATTARRSAVVAAAAKAQAVDPDAVFALLDHSTLEVGPDGAVTGADEAVASLLKAKPYLAGKAAPSFDGGARDTPQKLTPEQLKSMTPQQIADLDPKVVAAAFAPG